MHSHLPQNQAVLSYKQQEEYGVFTSEITSQCPSVSMWVVFLFHDFCRQRGLMSTNLPEGTQRLQLFLVMMSDLGTCCWYGILQSLFLLLMNVKWTGNQNLLVLEVHSLIKC